MTRTRRPWSKSIGERGNRVRLYEARPGGAHHAGNMDQRKGGSEESGPSGPRARDPTGLRAVAGRGANVQAIEDESLTLGMLASALPASPQHAAKKERTRLNDRRMLARVVGFLGANRNVLSLCESDVQRFTMARRQGKPDWQA